MSGPRWKSVDDKWQKRKATPPGGKLEEGVTYAVENWEIPGEDPLEVRVCTRTGFPMTKFSNARVTEKTSVVLHTTEGYGHFAGLMGSAGLDKNGKERKASAHFLLGRDGNAYQLVKTEWIAWHATWWNDNSIGIEVDCISNLHKVGNNLLSQYGTNDVYCTADDQGLFWEHEWPGKGKYWATWTEDQYVGVGRLVKALCHKHQIPRIILPEPDRYNPFKNPSDRKRFKGICTHLQIDPERKKDIGPIIDWDKLIRYAALDQGDCFNAPAYAPPTGPTTPEPGSAPASGSSSSSSSSTPTPTGDGPAPNRPTDHTSTQDVEVLRPPQQIDAKTVRFQVGHRPGRIALTVRKPGEPVPTPPPPGELPGPAAEGKRDEFIRAAMNFLGCSYRKSGRKPAEGIDGVGLVAICLKRIGLLKEDDPDLDGPGLWALFNHLGGVADSPPAEIVPGDLAWFGEGDHYTDAQQHPMVYLGGGRLLGPVPSGPHDGAVQVIAVKEVPEHFAGWSHIDDLGQGTSHTEHPGDPPAAGNKLTGALLPMSPAARYDALKALVQRMKGQWDDGKNKVNLLGVKNLHDRCQISPKPDDWNDTLYAAFLDDDGHKCCVELRASLNPGNDSQKAETWQLWEGSYKLKLVGGDSTGGAKALQPDGKVTGWFDAHGTGGPRPKDPVPDKPHKDDDKPEDKPRDPLKSEVPVPAGDQPWVFDAAGKKKSMRFGLRMMKALLEWELRRDPVDARFGCLYSSNGWVDSYKPNAPGQEWPELKQLMKIPPKGNVGGVDTWHAFGMSWASTNKTNCCNSQFAAIFAASRDGVLRVKRDDGVEEIDVVADTPVDDGLQQGDVSKGAAFAQTWINGGLCQLKTKKGKKLYELPAVPQTAAMTYLGVGEGVTAWGGKNLADVRIGDAGQWNAHSWLVSDIRYKVTLKGASKAAKAFQSDFARSEKPVVTWSGGKDAPKLKKEEVEWLEQHEPELEKRITDFLAAKSLTVDGEDREVQKIEVEAAQEFSANAVSYYAKSEEKHHGTAGGMVYVQAKTNGEKDLTGPWEYSDAETQESFLTLGVSRLWVPFASKGGAWGFARWYDHAGGAAPAKKKDEPPKKPDPPKKKDEPPKDDPPKKPDPGPEAQTGDWEQHKDGGTIPDDVLQQIRDARSRMPQVKLKPYGKNAETEGKYQYVSGTGSDHVKWLQGYLDKKAVKADAAKATAIRAFKILQGREGASTDLNTYDNQIVTWGTGFGGAGMLPPVLQKATAKAPRLKTLFHDCGFAYDKTYRVVDLRDGTVKKDKDPGLKAFRQQKELLYMLVFAAKDEATREAVLEAQLETFLGAAGAFPGHEKVKTDAAFVFLAHLHHWYPGYARGTVDHAYEKAGGGDPSADLDVKIALYAAREFCKRGGKAVTRPQLKGYWMEMRNVDGLPQAPADPNFDSDED